LKTARFTNTKGRYYWGGIIPPREKYVSVTSVLQAVGKPALVAWSARCEREMVTEVAAKLYAQNKTLEPAAFILALQALLGKTQAHTKELAKAGEIGSQIHELVEWSLRAELLQTVGKSPILSDQAQWAYQQFQRWRQGVKLKAISVETTVACHCHKIAGTMDLLCGIDGVLTVCDWKSGRRVYWEAKMQNAAYRHCVREMGLGDPQKGLILRLPKVLGEPDFEPVDAGDEDYYFQRFLNVKDTWDAMQREETPEDKVLIEGVAPGPPRAEIPTEL
jgi:hypothetical protein